MLRKKNKSKFHSNNNFRSNERSAAQLTVSAGAGADFGFSAGRQLWESGEGEGGYPPHCDHVQCYSLPQKPPVSTKNVVSSHFFILLI